MSAESDDIQIRASDFRRSWPNALARAMHAAATMIDRVELIESLQAEHQNRLEALGAKMPAAIRSTEERLTKCIAAAESSFQGAADAVLEKIEASGQIIHDNLHVTLAQVRAECTALASSQLKFSEMVIQFMAANEMERQDIKTSRIKLTKEIDAQERQERSRTKKALSAGKTIWSRIFHL